jgi:hypothetical protein
MAKDWLRRELDRRRVRAFIKVPVDDAATPEPDTRTKHERLRAQVISDITRRMSRLASELTMQNLSLAERNAIFKRLRQAMKKETH